MGLKQILENSKVRDIEKIIFILILIILSIYFDYSKIFITNYIDERYIKTTIIIFLLIWFGRVFEHLILTIIYEKQEKGSYLAEEVFIRENLTKILIWLSVIVIILTLIFRSPTSILTSLGIIGAGLTIALQQPLMNIVGWITIMLGRFYTVGDRIEIEGIKGDVYGINIMQTLIRRVNENDEPTGSSASIPNHFVLNRPLINYSKPSKFVWSSVAIDITYESNLLKAKELLLESFKEIVNYEEILGKVRRYKKLLKIHIFEQTPEPKLRVALKDSSVQLKLLYLTPIELKNELDSKIRENFLIKTRKEKDVEIAYPHLTIVKKE